MTYKPFTNSPNKRALLHMIRHGGLRRSNSKATWVGRDNTGAVRFGDVTIAALGECGLLSISVNRAHKAKQFAALTKEGRRVARALQTMVSAQRVVETALRPNESARERAGRTIEEAFS